MNKGQLSIYPENPGDYSAEGMKMERDKMRLKYRLKILVFVSLMALFSGCSHIQRLDQSKYDQSKEGIVLAKLLVGGAFGHHSSFYTTDIWWINKVNCNVKPWQLESFSDVNYRESYFNGGYMVTALATRGNTFCNIKLKLWVLVVVNNLL